MITPSVIHAMIVMTNLVRWCPVEICHPHRNSYRWHTPVESLEKSMARANRASPPRYCNRRLSEQMGEVIRIV